MHAPSLPQLALDTVKVFANARLTERQRQHLDALQVAATAFRESRKAVFARRKRIGRAQSVDRELVLRLAGEGLTQDAIAVEAGCNRSQVSRILKAHRLAHPTALDSEVESDPGVVDSELKS